MTALAIRFYMKCEKWYAEFFSNQNVKFLFSNYWILHKRKFHNSIALVGSAHCSDLIWITHLNNLDVLDENCQNKYFNK